MVVKRQTGFELLRLLSMGLVVLAHFIGWGTTHCVPDSGVTFSNGFILNALAYPFLSAFCALGVICFVMISGYFMCESSVLRFDRVLKVWVPTFFYSFVFAVSAYVSGRISVKEFAASFFPIGSDQYWFITKYIALVLLSPMINIVIRDLSQKGMCITIGIFSALTITITMGFPYGNVFFSDNPFSVAVFVLIYLLGAYVKKYSLPDYILSHCGILLLSVLFFQGLGGLAINYIRIGSGTLIGGFSVGYNALSLVPGFLLFVWFKNHSFKDSMFNRFLVSAAPYSLGVYLIHENIYVREFIWYGPFNMMDRWPSPIWSLYALLVPCLFLMIGCTVEFLRSRLFSLCRIDAFLSWVSQKNLTIK